jgi:effector-binding domain-containing protein
MSKYSKLTILTIFLLASAMIWYLFIKSYDYQISFHEKTAPGTVFYVIEGWTQALEKTEHISILESSKEHFSNIRQTLKMKDSTLLFNWKIESSNATNSKITIQVKDVNNSIRTRIKNLYTNPPLKQVLLSRTSQFKKSLDAHLKNHKVEINGYHDTPAKFYAYVSISSSLREKANQMILNNGDVVVWLKEQDIKVIGEPTLEVTSWNIDTDSIDFNFMFPIGEMDSIPQHTKIKFKKVKSRKALKATYHGNYRVSDRAWFALYEYARNNSIKIENKPLEIFYNNPMSGGDELTWKAEIFMPLNE